MGWPNSPVFGNSSAIRRVKAVMRSSRSSQDNVDGQTHATLNGVSPQPSALRPWRSSTRTRTRAHSARVTTCAPNFNGTRKVRREEKKLRLANGNIGRMAHRRFPAIK